MRSARGQGTVEYLAVVLLVALVVGGGTAAAASGAGADIAAAVPREVIRALCIVRGGDCYRDRAPCDVGSSARSTKWAVTIVVLNFGHDKTVTLTHRSDGKSTVTLSTAGVGGLETSTGVRGRLTTKKRTFAGGADVTAGVTGSLGHGRTWVLSTRAEAERLIAAIEDDAPLPPTDLEGHEASLAFGAHGAAGAKVNASAGVGAQLGGGSQTDRSTGNRTYFFTAGASADAKVSAKGTRAAASVSGQGQGRFALTVDRDGRWLDLAVTRTGSLSGEADLPEEVAPVAEALDVPTAAARRWVTEAHLDLTDAENLAAAQGVVAQAMDPLHPDGLADAFTVLSRRMGESAVVDARTYTVDTEGYGAEVHAGVELKAGARYDKSTEQMRLVAATTRGIDGRWRERHDCLEEAKS